MNEILETGQDHNAIAMNQLIREFQVANFFDSASEYFGQWYDKTQVPDEFQDWLAEHPDFEFAAPELLAEVSLYSRLDKLGAVKMVDGAERSVDLMNSVDELDFDPEIFVNSQTWKESKFGRIPAVSELFNPTSQLAKATRQTMRYAMFVGETTKDGADYWYGFHTSLAKGAVGVMAGMICDTYGELVLATRQTPYEIERSLVGDAMCEAAYIDNQRSTKPNWFSVTLGSSAHANFVAGYPNFSLKFRNMQGFDL